MMTEVTARGWSAPRKARNRIEAWNVRLTLGIPLSSI